MKNYKVPIGVCGCSSSYERLILEPQTSRTTYGEITFTGLRINDGERDREMEKAGCSFFLDVHQQRDVGFRTILVRLAKRVPNRFGRKKSYSIPGRVRTWDREKPLDLTEVLNQVLEFISGLSSHQRERWLGSLEDIQRNEREEP